MPWVRRLAAAVVRALAIAEVEDCPIADGFERRVVDLLARECPVAEVREWDRPSEQTVRLLPKAKAMVTPLGAVPAASAVPPAARTARG